jgi:hypothetical protein
MKVALEEAEETMREKPAPPAAQPPTAMKTFNPLFIFFKAVTRG